MVTAFRFDVDAPTLVTAVLTNSAPLGPLVPIGPPISRCLGHKGSIHRTRQDTALDGVSSLSDYADAYRIGHDVTWLSERDHM